MDGGAWWATQSMGSERGGHICVQSDLAHMRMYIYRERE